MESLIKNNHCGLYKINPDYFLCRFRFDKIYSANRNTEIVKIK